MVSAFTFSERAMLTSPILKEGNTMNSAQTRPLPNAADKAALKAIAATVIQSCPGLQDTAHEVASDLLKQQGLHDLDPDHVYFHRFKAAQSSTQSFTGWEHIREKPYESLTLTQLVIHRFRVTDQDNADLLDLYGGFYSAGPEVENFNESNEVRLHGNDVLKAFWNIDFSTLYGAKLTDFWDKYSDDYRTLAKCTFLSNAVQALDHKQLAAADYQHIVDAVIGPFTWPVSLAMLRSTHPVANDVRTVDVAGHVATRLLRFIDANGRQIVYLPGETPAFQAMKNEEEMHWWMLGELNQDASRKTFLSHFQLADRHEIEQNLTGLMNQLVSGWGRSDHHLINQMDQAVTGDAFSWLRDSIKNAMFAEASLSLTSNGDLRKKLWLGYLSAGLKVFGPMAAVGWPVALPVVVAGIASVGLNIDQAVNGKTAAERNAGLLAAALAAIETLFNAFFLKGPGPMLEIGAEVDAAEAAEMAELKESTTPAEPTPPEAETPEATIPDEVDIPPPPVEPPAPIAEQPATAPEVPDRYLCNELLDGRTPQGEPGKFEGIYRLDNDPPYAIQMDDNAYYVRYFADSKGGGHWAIVDPERPNQFMNSLPVRLNAEGQWERMPALRLRGGGQCFGKECTADIPLRVREPLPPQLPGEPAVEPQPSTSRGLRPITTRYDVELSERENLKKWAMNLPRTHVEMGFDSMGRPRIRDLFERHFAGKRMMLFESARAFYENLSWRNLPLRPEMPVLTREMPIADLIDRIFESTPGLVIGETLDRITSMRFMIENMPTLARHIDTLYVRRLLGDFAQAELNTYFQTGTMSEDLETYLTSLGADPAGQFNELALVKAARQNGVRIQALDCATSFKMNTRFTAIKEQMLTNHLTNDIMLNDSFINSPGKWVVLTGPENTNTFRGLAGISELEGGIGVRIEEINPGEAEGIDVDPGIEVDRGPFPADEMMRGTYDTLYADFRLQMQAPPVDWSEGALDRLLSSPGMYIFEKTPENFALVHRSQAGELVRTPVQQLADNHISIHRPTWPNISDVPYTSLEQLAHALSDHMGLLLQSRIPQ